MNHWENQLQSLGITQWHNGHVSKRRIQDMQTLESGYRITPFQLRSQNPQSSAPNTICPSPPNGRFQDLFHEDGCLTGGDVAYVACMPWPKNPQTRLGPTRPDSARLGPWPDAPCMVRPACSACVYPNLLRHKAPGPSTAPRCIC